jgi:PKD repeat protein
MALPDVWADVPAKAFVAEPVRLLAGLNIGSATGLTYTWHSSLTGQTLTGDSATLVYTVAGVDTLTLIATNAYGSDTLTQTVTVVDCSGVVTAHPWLVDFSTDFDCWRNLGNANWGYSVENNTLPFVYATGYSKHYILVSPAVQLPADSTGLQLYWRDKRYSISGQTYRVLVTTGERDSLSGYDTLYQSTLGTSWTQRSVSLADYAGQTVHIAFDVQRNSYSGTLYLCDVMMYNALVPMGTLEAPAVAVATGDSVQCTVHLAQGADSTLTYSWHSALLDSTMVTTDSVLTIVYPEAGSETLTVAVSNAHGTLELSKSYNVYTCNVVNTYPWEEDFSDAGGSYNVCWAIDGYSHNAPNSSYGGHDEETDEVWSFNNCMISSPSGGYMITPALAIPAGEMHIAFMVEFINQMMEIRVSPTASTDTAQFTDLLLTEPNTSNNIKRRWVNLDAYAG